jgi:UDP-galactose transporter B1
MRLAQELKLMGCIAGIYSCFIYFGIVQERVSSHSFPGEGRFPSVYFLVLAQCLFAAAAAVIPVLFSSPSTSNPHHAHHPHDDGKPKVPKQPPPQWCYAVLAISYLGAMLLTNFSLKWVDYPTQVIAKSVKPIPVMLMGVFMNGKRYSFGKYLRVIMMALGVAMFMYHPKEAAAERQAHALGYVCLVLSLACDGLTGPFQERIMMNYSSRGEYAMMLYTNMWSCLYLSLAVIASGEVQPVIQYLTRHPEVGVDIALSCTASAFGQAVIYYTITHFSSLVSSIITTTRKFLTLLSSVLYYGHHLELQQWLAVALVFGSLLMEVMSPQQLLALFIGRKSTASSHHHKKQH